MYIQGEPILNNPLEKLLYFNNGSTDLSQNGRILYVFMQYILKMLLK